jgi:hypothetical protein
LKGVTTSGHRTKIYLNNTMIDDQTWANRIFFTHDVQIPHALLNNGDNVFRVETIDLASGYEQILVNWFEVDYSHSYQSSNNELLAGVPGGGTFRFSLSGYDTNDIAVYEVTAASAPKLMLNGQIQSASGKYAIQYQATVGAAARHLVLTPARYLTPVSIQVDSPSSWHSSAHGADYIIITHSNFAAEAQRLANHRATQGLRTVVVDVDDLYDEFQNGVFNPSAIRDFLAYAYTNWQPPAPTAVVLFGDAYMDYRDIIQSGSINYVPSQVIETIGWGQTPSDNWYVAISGPDPLPDMFIGRLSASTAAEATILVDKIIQYDLVPPDSAWDKKALAVTDDTFGNIFDDASEALVRRMPYYYNVQRVYAAGYNGNDGRDPSVDIANAINGSVLMVSYIGHGNIERWGTWAKGVIFDKPRIDALANANRLPFVVIGNCLNGYFAEQNERKSFAEEFHLQAQRGAIALFAPAALGATPIHTFLLGEVYDAVFQDDITALGAATTAAKLAGYQEQPLFRSLFDSFVLLGDPMTKLGIATNYPYLVQTSPTNNAQEVAIGEPIRITFSKPVVPASVTVTGPDAAALQLAPSWNADNTVLTLNHLNFTPGRAYSFTVQQAKDKLGNSLGAGLVPATWSFTVTRLDQAITFAPLPDKTIGSPPFAISATATSGLPVSFASNTAAVCTVAGSTVTLVKTGECSITASQAGSSAYKPAPTVTQAFIVADPAKQDQTITFNALPDKKLGDPPFALNATASSGLPVSFASNTPAVCTVAGNTATLVAVGQCSITASQAGSATYNAARSVTQTFLVTSPAKQAQTIAFAPLPDRTLGEPSFSIVATASSGLPVIFTSDTPAFCQVAKNTVTLMAAGECSITARQAGDATYNPAPSVTQRFVIASPTKQSQTITFASLPNKTLGDPPFAVSATASSGLPVTFTGLTPVVCTVTGNTVTLLAAGQCSILASQGGNTAYNAARSVNRTFQVSAPAGMQLFLPAIRK